MKKLILIAFACLWSVAALANAVMFTSQAAFVGATGATLRDFAPGGGTFIPSRDTADGSINAHPFANNIIFDPVTYGNPIPGKDWVISDQESQNFFINGPGMPAYSFGFDMYKPFEDTGIIGTPNCFATCVDSTFTVTLMSGGVALPGSTFSWIPPHDQVAFYGFFSDTPFDQVQLIESPPAIDDEYFANLYLGNTPPAVPEPATLVLMGGGLLAIARRIRRK